MSQWEKLLEKIRNNPKNVRFTELDKVLIKSGFTRTQSNKGTSHFVYRKGRSQVSVPKHDKHVKYVYVLQALDAIQKED